MKDLIKSSLKTLQKNSGLLMNLLFVLLFLMLVMYVIPGLLFLLFNSLLGNLIILIVILLVAMKNIKYGIGLILISLIIMRFSHMKI